MNDRTQTSASDVEAIHHQSLVRGTNMNVTNDDYMLTNDDDNLHLGATKSSSVLLGRQESIRSVNTLTMPRVDSQFLPPSLHEHLGNLVTSRHFQQLMLFFIVWNGLLTAIGTFDFSEGVEVYFAHADFIFLCIFTVELCLHAAYYETRLFNDGWLIFDFIVVTCSWIFQAMSVLRAFRIVRAVRIISKTKDLKDLVTALLRVMPRMGAIASLLLLIYFVFTIFFTELFKDAYANGITSEDHFSTLGLTAFTLLQFMFLDDWSTVTKELMAVYPLSLIPILTFIIICTFIVVNLIIAVICDAVAAIQTDEMSANLNSMERATKEAIWKAESKQVHEIHRLERKIDHMMKLLEEKQKT